MEDADGADRLYLVRETKSTLTFEEVRPDEKRKIECGRKHFKDALGVNYQVVTTAKRLPIGAYKQIFVRRPYRGHDGGYAVWHLHPRISIPRQGSYFVRGKAANKAIA